MVLIFKHPFPNGSNGNGVCRALWAMSQKRLFGYKINHTEKVSYSPSENLTFWSEKYGQGNYFSFEDDSIMPIISSSKAV